MERWITVDANKLTVHINLCNTYESLLYQVEEEFKRNEFIRLYNKSAQIVNNILKENLYVIYPLEEEENKMVEVDAKLLSRHITACFVYDKLIQEFKAGDEDNRLQWMKAYNESADIINTSLGLDDVVNLYPIGGGKK